MKADVAPWDANPSTVLQPDGFSMRTGSFGVRVRMPTEPGGLMELDDGARVFLRRIAFVSRIRSEVAASRVDAGRCPW